MINVNNRVFPLQHLISSLDKARHKSKECCYRNCQEEPISSHTIPENYLYKLNNNLSEVLTFEPSCISRLPDNSNPRYIKNIDKEKFSTFLGFCKKHDNNLFKEIDEFNGQINKKKAALIHYRNICYGIHHIKISSERVQYLSRQNYEGESTPESVECLKNLKNGYFENRLNSCLDEHNLRKEMLEIMIDTGNFTSMNFFSIGLGLEQPIFSGRSHYILHPEEHICLEGGYPYFPWISYMTLRTNTRNDLLFSWLEKDTNKAKYLENIIGKEIELKNLIGTLAYACSDALAMNQKLYNQNCKIINEAFKSLRAY